MSKAAGEGGITENDVEGTRVISESVSGQVRSISFEKTLLLFFLFL